MFKCAAVKGGGSLGHTNQETTNLYGFMCSYFFLLIKCFLYGSLQKYLAVVSACSLRRSQYMEQNNGPLQINGGIKSNIKYCSDQGGF